MEDLAMVALVCSEITVILGALGLAIWSQSWRLLVSNCNMMKGAINVWL